MTVSRRVRTADRSLVQAETRSAVRTLQNATYSSIRAQLDVPPLTLTLSPEYEGEGTRGALT
ncbi:MAG: hypothetical protein JWL69_5048 [Phycisphaerales bacterium]|nr:hypothetical protein [Phycisphaerales bacterium]